MVNQTGNQGFKGEGISQDGENIEEDDALRDEKQ